MADPAAGRARDAAAQSLLAGSAGPLSACYDVALLDLDGVVYLGTSAVPGAVEALASASAAGMRLAFVTNNASRTPSAIAAQLAALGIAASARDVVTSAQAAARLLAERLPAGAPVLVAGGMGLRMAVRERGFRPVTLASERPLAVVQGWAPDIGYPLLAEAALAVQAGAVFIASNGDITLPTARGRQPGNGSMVEVIVTATGRRPEIAGKPEPPLHAEAVARSGAGHPLVVGDRLDTDIEGAVRVGADSMLVLTGVTHPVDAVLAPAGRRPRFLARDLAGLHIPHPGVSASGRGWSCAGWTARWEGGRVVMDGDGEPMDGLRALCAAAWSRKAAGPGGVREALRRLGW